MEERREERRNGWHMSKSLSVSHIFSTVAIAVGLFSYVAGLEKETVINSMDVKSLSDRMDRTNARHSEQFSEIQDMLKSFADKIDNLGHLREL